MPEVELDGDGRRLLDQLFDKWSLLALAALCDRPRRFNELRQDLPAVTPKSLTTCLRRLERNGMVERAVVSTDPVAIEYRITPWAEPFGPLCAPCWNGPSITSTRSKPPVAATTSGTWTTDVPARVARTAPGLPTGHAEPFAMCGQSQAGTETAVAAFRQEL